MNSYHMSTKDRKWSVNERWVGNWGESSVTICDQTSKSLWQFEYGCTFVASSI